MATISKGEVLMTGQPNDAIAAMRARVWSRMVAKSARPEYQSRFPVLSTRLIAGQPLIHVYHESRPEEGFAPVDPNLEDVYFHRLRNVG